MSLNFFSGPVPSGQGEAKDPPKMHSKRPPLRNLLNKNLTNKFGKNKAKTSQNLPMMKPSTDKNDYYSSEDHHQQEEHRDVQEEDQPQDEVFRTKGVWLDEDDEINKMWTLKRATPVFDEEEDRDFALYESPSKRQRVVQLDWKQSIADDEEPILCEDLFCRRA